MGDNDIMEYKYEMTTEDKDKEMYDFYMDDMDKGELVDAFIASEKMNQSLANDIQIMHEYISRDSFERTIREVHDILMSKAKELEDSCNINTPIGSANTGRVRAYKFIADDIECLYMSQV